MPEVDRTITETDKDLIIEALKNYHKNLGQKIDRSNSNDNLRKYQKTRQDIRELAAIKFNLGYEEVNQWD